MTPLADLIGDSPRLAEGHRLHAIGRGNPVAQEQASRARYDLLERLATHPALLDAAQRAALREAIRRLP
jgi:hypothetical protein